MNELLPSILTSKADDEEVFISEADGDVITYGVDGTKNVSVSDSNDFIHSSFLTESNNNEATTKNGEEEIVIKDDIIIDPLKSFEVFQGKVFFSNEEFQIPIKLPKSSTVGEESIQTPHHRLTKLRYEMMELHQEIKESSTLQLKHSYLLPLANELSSRLNQMTINSNESRIESTVEEPVLPVIRAPKKEHDLNLEERIKNLENILGNTTTIPHTTSLLKRITKLEKIISIMSSEQTLQSSINRASILKNELTEALKSKSLLQQQPVVQEDEKTTQLYEQLTSLEEISSQLPFVIERLRVLSVLHSKASLFQNKMEGLEEDVGKLERSLKNVEVSWLEMNEGMLENMQKMEDFLKVVDQRIDNVKCLSIENESEIF